jgi:hypothetical protein
MSKHNKVNRDNYTQAGRLTPDEMAREHSQRQIAPAKPRRETVIGKTRAGERGSTRPRNAREE